MTKPSKKPQPPKKKPAAPPAKFPVSFSGVIRGHTRAIQAVAQALRDLVYDEVPNAEERFYGARRSIAMYRSTADVCWIQPHTAHCNIYFPRGMELTDPDGILEGSSERMKHAKVRSLDDLERLPLRAWIQETLSLNEATIAGGMTYEQVLNKVRTICLPLPGTKETLTWGIPHFRVADKIYCGCSEAQGRSQIGLKMEPYQSEVMMKVPGIKKAPYSRKGDGWVTIDPGTFDDWEQIEQFLVASYHLIAPKSLAEPAGSKPKRKARRR